MNAPLVALKRPPSDLAEQLRKLADLAESGQLTGFCGAYNESGVYGFIYGTTMHDCIVMASMLWTNCLDRARA